MISREHTPQTSLDPFTEARMHDNLDSWLTHVSEDCLRYLSEVSAQAAYSAYGDEGVKDTATLTALVGIAMLFSGKQTMSISDVILAFQTLTDHMATEIHVREGNATKEGVYSMMPEENTLMITLTKKGQETLGQQRNQ